MDVLVDFLSKYTSVAFNLFLKIILLGIVVFSSLVILILTILKDKR